MLTDPEAREAYRIARTTCPSVSLSWESFLAAARDLHIEPQNLAGSATDFYLACAAGQGDSEAIRVIDERFVPQLSRRIKRLGTPADKVPDVLQAIRERLFTGPTPRIRTYNGAVPLEQWLRIVAGRVSIDLHRQEAALPRAEVGLAELLMSRSPDTAELVMKSQYKKEFESALRTELLGLSSRDRAVLRLHVVEGVSLEKVAIMYGVHRVTVARWVWTAGEAVLDGLRRRFREQFGLMPQDFDSLVHLVRSQLSLGLEDVLGEPADPAQPQGTRVRR